jgi:hypothetical protein
MSRQVQSAPENLIKNAPKRPVRAAAESYCTAGHPAVDTLLRCHSSRPRYQHREAGKKFDFRVAILA